MATHRATAAHEFAAIFPLHEGEPLWELSDSVKKNGLRDKIVLLGEKILDGRRRELACFRAGITPAYRNFGSRATDGDDPLEFVVDCNLHRRHLGEGERAIVAARYTSSKAGRPKEGDVTNSEAAEKFDTSERSVARAKVVNEKCTKAVQEAVSADLVSLSDAEAVAEESAGRQNKAVEAVRTGKAKTLKAALKKLDKVKATRSAPAVLKDRVGVEVPKKLRDVFADGSLAELAGLLGEAAECVEAEKWAKKVTKLCDHYPYLLAEKFHDAVLTSLEKLQLARELIENGIPYAVCPKCVGEGCQRCRQAGYVPEHRYQELKGE